MLLHEFIIEQGTISNFASSIVTTDVRTLKSVLLYHDRKRYITQR